jgi:hypothetical protein
MNNFAMQTRSAVRRVASWGGLIYYLLGFSPVGLATAAWLGTFDPDHHALVRLNAQGACLVLHHERGCAPHQHHALARALSLFAQRSTQEEPDHVLSFVQGEYVSDESAIERLSVSASEPVQCGEAGLQLPAPLTSVWGRFPRPPPGFSDQLRNVRLTPLLI